MCQIGYVRVKGRVGKGRHVIKKYQKGVLVTCCQGLRIRLMNTSNHIQLQLRTHFSKIFQTQCCDID